MKFIDISAMAYRDDKYQFEQIISKCKYYAVALPHGKDSDISYMLFDNNNVTEIRIVSDLELKYFAKSVNVIFQNDSEIYMNFDGN